MSLALTAADELILLTMYFYTLERDDLDIGFDLDDDGIPETRLSPHGANNARGIIERYGFDPADMDSVRGCINQLNDVVIWNNVTSTNNVVS